MKINETLARIINRTTNSPIFNIMEIGALPLGERPEPFHELIQAFPGSRVNAFEVDPELCKKLNSNAAKGMTYHPVALGRKEEVRPFYMTNHPMCASLYRPDEKLIERYNNMEVAMLKSVDTINTVSLDYFVRENKIGPVDFIKIDVQGAELEVFEGGSSTLKDVVAIVTEVEFVRIYEDQPLFGNVCESLERFGLSFHKFLGMSGRALRPLVMNNNPNYATQHMWTDAMFIKNPMMLDSLSSGQLLKLAVLASIYGSPDVTVYCIMEYDRRNGTEINRELQSTLLAGSNSSKVGRNDPCPCGSGKRYKNCHGDLQNV